MSLYKRLCELRMSAGMTQEALANALGISRTAIVNYENGKREPDYEMLAKMAAFFNTTTDYLLGISNKRYSVPMTIAEAREQYLAPTGNVHEDRRRRELMEHLMRRGNSLGLDQLEVYVKALDDLAQIARKMAKDDEMGGES